MYHIFSSDVSAVSFSHNSFAVEAEVTNWEKQRVESVLYLKTASGIVRIANCL